MLKNRIIHWIIAGAVLAAVTGGVGFVAEQLGQPVSAVACNKPTGSSGGGGC